MAVEPIERFRRICLALPEVVELETWGQPTFRVGKKMLASCARNADDRPIFSCKAQPGEQPRFIAADPTRFYSPSHVGVHGWVGGFLDGRAPWDEIAELVEEAWRMTAPKRLVKEHER